MRVGAWSRRLAATSAVLLPIVAVAPSPMASTASASGFSCTSGGAVYEVRAGDSWYAVAGRVDVDVPALLDANAASVGDALFPGDRLCLPAGADPTGACATTDTVRSGDGWSTIARRAGVAMSSVVALNGGDAGRIVHPGDSVCLPADAAVGTSSPAASGSGYIVESGDSWFLIADRADVTTRALLEANGASAADALHPGQEIRLPAGASRPIPDSSGSSRRSPSGWVELEALPTQGPCWYHDTWGAPRPGGRRHVGTDIFTVRGEHLYAVADGRLTGRKWSQPGNISGNAWWLTANDGTVFFYAHLADFAPDLGVGSTVRAGQIIGWVGKTGNTTADHLHFEIRPGGGSPVNPYPILRAHGGACNQGAPYTQPGGWVPD